MQPAQGARCHEDRHTFPQNPAASHPCSWMDFSVLEEVLGCSQPPGLFLGGNSVDLPLTRHRPRPQDRKKTAWQGERKPVPLSPLPGRLEDEKGVHTMDTIPFPPAGHSPRAEHTAATATQSRKPSRFFRAFSGLRSCFQPLPTLPPVDTKKGQGVR